MTKRNAKTRAAAPRQLDVYRRLSDLRIEDLNDRGESDALNEHERLLKDLTGRLGFGIAETLTENDMKDGKPKPASAYTRKRVALADGTTVLRVIRPTFARVIERIRSGVTGGFVCVDLDRAVRDPRDLEDLIDAVEATGANVRSLTGSLAFTDGGTDAEITLARVMVAMGNKASRDTGRRVSAARLRQALNGQNGGGGHRAFGFELDRETPIVSEYREVADWHNAVLTDVSLKQIARDLRDRKVPTVTGAEWTPETVRGILLRPRNAGFMVHDGESLKVRGPWPPIVPEDIHRSVVKKLTDPHRQTTPGPASVTIGAGIYECGVCGGVMRRKIARDHRRDSERDTYVCAINHVRRPRARTDALVIDAVVELMSRADVARIFAVRDADGIDVGALREEVRALRLRQTESAEMFTDGEITRAELAVMRARFSKRLEAAQSALDAQTTRSAAESLIGATDVRAAFLAMSLGTQRAIVSELFVVQIMPGATRSFDPRLISIRPNAA